MFQTCPQTSTRNSTGQPRALTFPQTLIFQLCLTVLLSSGSYLSLKNKGIPGKHVLGLFFGIFSHHREKQEVQGAGQCFLFPFPRVLFSPMLIFCVPAALCDLPSSILGRVTSLRGVLKTQPDTNSVVEGHWDTTGRFLFSQETLVGVGERRKLFCKLKRMICHLAKAQSGFCLGFSKEPERVNVQLASKHTEIWTAATSNYGIPDHSQLCHRLRTAVPTPA